jgi:hypothetical protein
MSQEHIKATRSPKASFLSQAQSTLTLRHCVDPSHFQLTSFIKQSRTHLPIYPHQPQQSHPPSTSSFPFAPSISFPSSLSRHSSLPAYNLHNMTSKLVPSDPAKVMVIRDVVPKTITTFSTPFWRFGRIKFGGRGTVGKRHSLSNVT